ncbi:hypothetical protein [Microbacterium halotolerans]|uniref:hypothetical protein n=1 Tax=Microbacterium halotolerans TaxID=246613 RepID=UPI000E6AB869|nr:hypothetical protein [Microbacterium halotolerans]
MHDDEDGSPLGRDEPAPIPTSGRPWKRTWRRSLAFAMASIGVPFVAAGFVLALLIALSHPSAGPSAFLSPLLPVAMALVSVAAMTLFVRRSRWHSRTVWAVMAIGSCLLSIAATMIAFALIAGLQSGWLGLWFGAVGTMMAAFYFCTLGGPLWAAAGAVAGARIVGVERRADLWRFGLATAAIGAVVATAAAWIAHGDPSGDSALARCSGYSAQMPVEGDFSGGWSWFPLGWDCQWGSTRAIDVVFWPTFPFSIGIALAVLGLALILANLPHRHRSS